MRGKIQTKQLDVKIQSSSKELTVNCVVQFSSQ